MRSSKYVGKHAYRDEIALNYERDRKKEAVWESEQEFVAQWIGTLPANASVLDIPTGTGRFIGLFLQRNLRVFAMDISGDMLAEVRKSHSTEQNLVIEKGDAEHLTLADDAIDYLVSWRFFHLIPLSIIQQVLAEFYRVCRGTVVVQVFAVDCSNARPKLMDHIKNLLRPLLRWCWERGNSKLETPWAHIKSFCHREDHLLAAFARAGFMVEKIHEFEVAESAPAKVYFLLREKHSSGANLG